MTAAFLARLLAAPPLRRAGDGPLDWARSPTFRSLVSFPVAWAA